MSIAPDTFRPRATSPATGEVADDDQVDAYYGEGSAMQKLRHQADAVVDRIRPQIETAQDFARNDPMKAVLISAAAGAALMAVVGLVVRASSRPWPVRRLEREGSRAASYLASVREAAVDLADRAQSAAHSALAASQSAWSKGRDAVDRGREQVERGREAVDEGRSAFESQKKRATDAAHEAQDALADTWSSIRDQAQPLIDKLRPQIDAAVDYARNDPTRTAIGLATAGAVIVGLLSLLGDSDD
jgi:ElaB/YqjD/DUF883 family membrane-anchored ribosome-binding protein